MLRKGFGFKHVPLGFVSDLENEDHERRFAGFTIAGMCVCVGNVIKCAWPIIMCLLTLGLSQNNVSFVSKARR